MNKQLMKQLESVRQGDLVLLEWTDASVGKSMASGMDIDIPVRSWGVYIGLMGQKNKHVVLAQTTYKFSETFYDIDYVSVPFSWTANIQVMIKACVSVEVTNVLRNSFLVGGHRAGAHRNAHSRQMRVRRHGRHF